MINDILMEKPIQLINVLYNRAQKISQGKYSDDSIDVIYRNERGEKCIATETSPNISVYKTKDGIVPEVPLDYIPKKDVNLYEVPYRYRELEIAKLMGDEYVNRHYQMLKNKEFRATKEIHKSKYIYRSDMEITDYYRIEYALKCKPIENLSKFHVAKSFLDIEVDIRDYHGTVDELVEDCDRPVNVVTLLLKDQKKVFTLVLRDKTDDQVKDLENNVGEFINELKDSLGEEISDIKQLSRFKEDFDLDYNVFWYDDELNLITDLFEILHEYKPDFTAIWNMRFDITYLKRRIEVLKGDPIAIMCHPDFKTKKCNLRWDNRAEKIEERTDIAEISAYNVFIDQMITYGGLRKGGSKIESLALNFIGDKEAGFEKEDYSKIAPNLGELIKRDFALFIKYNIRDVLVQYAVELLVEDIDNIYLRSLKTATSYNKMFKPSVFLKNRFTIDYDKQGLIICNNRNADYTGEGYGVKEKFEGAVVGDPANNMHNGIDIYGTGNNSMTIFDDVIDFDLSSLYPSIITACNICNAAQYFRLYIDNVVNEHENYYGEERYDRGGNFIDDLETRSWLRMGSKWFNLPTMDTMLEELKELDDSNRVVVEKVDKIYITKEA